MSEGNRPDLEVFVVRVEKDKDGNPKDRFYKVGALWANKKERGFNGSTAFGRLVLLEPKPPSESKPVDVTGEYKW